MPQGVVGAPVWSPDSASIAFTATRAMRDRSRPYRVDRHTYRFDGIGLVEDGLTDVYVVDVESGAVRGLTDDDCMNSEPRWSPSGDEIAYLVSFPPDEPWDFLPDLNVVSVADRTTRGLVGSWGGVFGAAWTQAGDRIAFVGMEATDALDLWGHKRDLWVVDAAGGEPECRTTSVEAGVGLKIQVDLPTYPDLVIPRIVMAGDVAYVSGQRGADVVVYRVALDGPQTVDLVSGDVGRSSYLVDVDAQGRVLALETSHLDPPELTVDARRVTHENDDLLAQLERPTVRRLQARAEDGLETEAWALVPSAGGSPWPTVLYIHGGPHGTFGSTFMIDFHLLAAAGFAVLFHNFRGSGGYGNSFSDAIRGDWGRQGALDHHATVDEAIRVGIADPNRIGVCGYSHGGFATCWLVGTSDRFRAAVSENPVTNWSSAFGAIDSETWVEAELGGTPWDAPDRYRKYSPLSYAPTCGTPLLFIVGEADLRCLPTEAEQYYRVVKRNGVATEMLRLPNASHIGTWTGPLAVRAAQNEALIEWFTRFLLGEDGQ
jgi:dipeptidyl aminopeptidase/acylaminoacyl peptidase